MAKVVNNPLGNYLGKLGDTVGAKWKGVYWIRRMAYPQQRGSLEMYYLLKAGLIPPGRFSFRQMNQRRLVFQVIGCIGSKNLLTLTIPVWERLCKEKKLNMTGTNLLIKKNVKTLWASMPQQDKEYDAITNTPDFVKMVVSDGILEPTQKVIACAYNSTTGILRIEWDSSCIENGKPDDYAYIMAYKKPVVDSEWKPNGVLYGRATLPEPPVSPRTRVDGSMEIALPKGLTATDIIGYVFFRDNADIIGFSTSMGKAAA